MVPALTLEHVEKRFPNGLLALRDANLQVSAGEFVSLVGPSGCGKSTVLRLVAGLDVPTAGRVDAPALASGSGLKNTHDPHTSFVFQEPTLMPWATVFDNVWLPLRLAGQSRPQVQAAVREMLALVGLSDFENSYPAALSGGMKMRVSIARALVTRPRLLLMDEPFAALDEISRNRLNADLLKLWSIHTFSVLFVTHSVFESVYLSQRVFVMSSRPGGMVAEVNVDAPYPRDASFRGAPVYLNATQAVSAALEAAQDPVMP